MSQSLFNRVCSFVLVLSLLLASSCATTDYTSSTYTDIPDSFKELNGSEIRKTVVGSIHIWSEGYHTYYSPSGERVSIAKGNHEVSRVGNNDSWYIKGNNICDSFISLDNGDRIKGDCESVYLNENTGQVLLINAKHAKHGKMIRWTLNNLVERNIFPVDRTSHKQLLDGYRIAQTQSRTKFAASGGTTTSPSYAVENLINNITKQVVVINSKNQSKQQANGSSRSNTIQPLASNTNRNSSSTIQPLANNTSRNSSGTVQPLANNTNTNTNNSNQRSRIGKDAKHCLVDYGKKYGNKCSYDITVAHCIMSKGSGYCYNRGKFDFWGSRIIKAGEQNLKYDYRRDGRLIIGVCKIENSGTYQVHVKPLSNGQYRCSILSH